jgi:hypothetical protein
MSKQTLALLLAVVVLVTGAVQATAGRSDSGEATSQARAGTAPRNPNGQAAGNNLGWQVGTGWTVQVEEYADYLAEAEWITSEYRFEVVAVDAASGTFTVVMRFADPSIQPATAQGDLLTAEYAVTNGSLRLATVQPASNGPKVTPVEARALLGENFLELDLPAEPFAGGASADVDAPGLGRVRANEVRFGQNEQARFTPGAPWWVSYAKGQTLKATLTGFTP